MLKDLISFTGTVPVLKILRSAAVSSGLKCCFAQGSSDSTSIPPGAPAGHHSLISWPELKPAALNAADWDQVVQG